jgi:oxaloacetate decarboxylase beta subunit
MGFGAIIINLPGVVPFVDKMLVEEGPLHTLFNAGIANELFPLILFIGIGAMIDFGPLLSNPKLLIFGAAAQFGIFFTLGAASLLGFELKDAASIAIIGAADGPTSIFVATELGSKYLGAIMVAAYSYMALVPLVQPPIIKLCTTKAERRIKMQYKGKPVSKLTKILFPIVVTVIVGLVAPDAVALIGFLMFGNLIRECGVMSSISETAQNALANLITIFLGITIASQMKASEFLQLDTLVIIGLGLVAFVFDTFGGIMVAKIMNLFSKEKINPMIGAAGISAFPMSGRIVHKMGLQEDPQNFLLMHSIGVNVSGQIASVIAGGLILKFFM